jgi:hypothetical protein
MLQIGKVAGSNPDELDFLNLPNPSSHNMRNGNIPGAKGRPAPKADKLTAICEAIV